MKCIIDEIKTCLDNKCYLAAIELSLTLPDICGKAEYPGEKTALRYKKWYQEYVGKDEKPASVYSQDMPYPSSELIYGLRNQLFHQGTIDTEPEKVKDDNCKTDRFTLVITKDYDSGTSMVAYGDGGQIVSRELEVNVHYLCNVLCRAAYKYFIENETKFSFLHCNLVVRED